VRAEALDRLAGGRVKRDEPRPAVHEDPELAAVAPRRHPAMNEARAIRRLTGLIGMRVVTPLLGARLGVERRDAVKGRAHVEHVVDHERGVFEGSRPRAGGGLDPLVAGLPFPGKPDAGEVAAVDVGERRVMGRRRIGGIDRPVLARRRRRPQRAAKERDGQDAERQESGSHGGMIRARSLPRQLTRAAPSCPVRVPCATGSVRRARHVRIPRILQRKAHRPTR
jgi:hypothetical protein